MKIDQIKTMVRWTIGVLFMGLTVFCMYQSRLNVQERYNDIALISVHYQPGPLSDLR